MPSFKEMKKRLFGKKKGDETEKKEKNEKKKKKKDRKSKSNAEELQSMMAMEEEQEHPLETLSRELLQREEQMRTSGGLSEEDQSKLRQDLDQLWSQMELEVQNIFTPSFSRQALRAALRCVQQQEDMDQSWSSLDSGLVPVWRPMKALQKHNEQLKNMIQARLAQHPLQDGPKNQFEIKEAHEQDGPEVQKGSNQDSVDVTREVRCLSEQIRKDLLYIESNVAPCYPEHMDSLNTYVKLYHSCFSSRLEQLVASSLNESALYCLLDCARHGYRRDILRDLENKVDSDSLGPLLPVDVLQKLQEDFLNITQNTTQEWLGRALKIEEESWESFRQTQDTSYCHSPLASDVIQMLHSLFLKVSSAGVDQSRQTLSADLDSFLCRYVKAVVEFVKGNHSNVPSVLKAQLVCEEQFRDFVLKQDMDAKKRESCLESLDALRDCGYCSLTSGMCSKLKEQLKGLWTEQWLDGSLSVVDSLLDFLDQELEQLSDLKPSCCQWVLGRLHRDVALRYFTNLLKTSRRSQTQQERGASRMKEDVDKMKDFFTRRVTQQPQSGSLSQGSSGQHLETKGSGSEWVTEILRHVAEVLALKGPESVKIELSHLVNFCPDLRSVDVSRLLMLKAGFSSNVIRSIKQTVKENRPQEPSANHCPPFFSLLKAPSLLQSVGLWLQLRLCTCSCNLMCCRWPSG